MTRRVVGVLGGMGPEATILLQQRLLKIVDASDDADHLPLLIDMNPQVPSRIAHVIERKGENPGPVLASMARRLEDAGATALAMPCNTAHYYAPNIVTAASVPLLNMVTLSVAKAAQQLTPGSTIGILASPAVKTAGVFDTALKGAGFTSLWPQDLDKMLSAIKAVKASGPVREAKDILKSAARELANNGADLLFVACSEFSLMTPDLDAEVSVIDTVDVLVSAIHHHITNETS